MRGSGRLGRGVVRPSPQPEKRYFRSNGLQIKQRQTHSLNVTVSNSIQIAAFDWAQPLKLGEEPTKRRLDQEAVMSEVSVFRLYAKEAMRSASTAVDESEKRTLEELAVIWAQAALMSDRVFGSSFTPSPPDVRERN